MASFRVASVSNSMKQALRAQNAFMIAFDIALGSVAIAKPKLGLKLLGHSKPSHDAEWLFRRCGPIWLTFAAAHLVAATRGDSRDWWALAWLRGTELATDALWAQGPGFEDDARARATMRLAGVANGLMAVGFAALAAAEDE
jgi:hypothetical protein